jgi:hypothetical protein
MTNLNKVVSSLRGEYSRLEKEMDRVGKAKVRKQAAKLVKS